MAEEEQVKSVIASLKQTIKDTHYYRPVLGIAVATIFLILLAWLAWMLLGKSSDALNGLILFSGVLASAAIGFTGLIINSDLQERLRTQASHTTDEERKKVLAAAFAGEAEAIARHVNSIGAAMMSAGSNEFHLPGYGREHHLWPEPAQTLYIANASEIGVLGPEIVMKIAERYGKLALWRDLNNGRTHQVPGFQELITRGERLREEEVPKWSELRKELAEIAGVNSPGSHVP